MNNIENRNNKSRIILIAGCTSSGKTKITELLLKNLKKANKKTVVLQMDNYYKELVDFNSKDREEINWDVPESFDWIKLKEDLKALYSGKKIEKNIYDYETSSYLNEKIILDGKGSEFIILEGLFSLYDKEIIQMADFKFFVHSNPDIRLARRIIRDKEERYSKGTFDLKFFIEKWSKKIEPKNKLFVSPTIKNADLIINNNFVDKESLSEVRKKVNMIFNLLK